MLIDDIKTQMKIAMKEKRNTEKEILRVALGELQTAEARAGEPLSEDAAQKVIRKLITSNEATIEAISDENEQNKLRLENQTLDALLPKMLSVDEIIAALESVKSTIVDAKADGPATGIAMKHLKSTGAAVDGASVTAAVKSIRGA